MYERTKIDGGRETRIVATEGVDPLAARIAELEDCIRALVETAHEPAHVRTGVIERAQRTLAKR